jgi:hypothetical protein
MKTSSSWLTWPFVAVWNLLTWILNLTGRIVAGVIGFVLMIVGIVLTITIIGAPIGIPLIVFGFMLMVRSVF